MKLHAVAAPSRATLSRWARALPGRRALVWGDFVLDEYVRCLSRRVSREAPVLILDWQARSVQPGGAANAALNLASLGARVSVVGLVGADPAGRELRELLERARIDTTGLVEHPNAETVVKTRVVAGAVHTALQQVLRIDRGGRFAARSSAVVRSLAAALESAGGSAEAVVLSDYGYGSVTPERAAPWIARWRDAGATVAVDSRHAVMRYSGVTLATPNESEASEAADLEIASGRDLERVAARLIARMRVEHLIVTRGRDGLTLWN
ncbi:MAG: sugar kinase, partial [Candidatus Eisenbacteria bacterium]|nr:sugar kinase [Candidatus Eisenbacteria bacterium]